MQENEEQLTDLPYTVIGGSGFPVPKRRICFTGKGIKAIADKVSSEDTVVYEAWKDCSDKCENVKYYSRWSVIKHAENKTQGDSK